jgi:sigma-B regulation protein RsbU (phosphoserine phosphatase)
MSKLVMLQGGQSTPYDLTADEVFLGRNPDCGIQLQSNMVSRRHARVFKEGDKVLIEDLGSGNGTFVNGTKIESSTVLEHEARIKLGPILLRFESDHATPAPSAAVSAAVSAVAAAAQTGEFALDISSGEDDESTIMGAAENVGGFGMLDVQPEAKLKAVIDISRSLAGTVDVVEILPRILDTLFEIFPHADRGSILLKDLETGKMIPTAQKHRREDEDATVRLSRTILNKVLEDKAGILSADAANDDRFDASESISNLTIRSMMCVPLLSLNGEPMGVISIDTQNPLNQFKKEDLDLLLAVAGQAALSYESARLLVTYMQKQKQDSEMQIAMAVQRALLPEELPQVEGYEFFASYDSAQAVGGDYYDVIVLDDDKVCLSFGDVAGKGVPGALIMSRISSVVQNTMRFCQNVGDAIATINDMMCVNMAEGRFVTYVLAIVDTKTHEMTLVNAGHMSPMIRKADGSVEEFDEDTIGLPIGVMEDYPYEVVSRKIGPGETIVLFTDGVDEAMDPEGELYTLQRLRAFVENGPASTTEMGETLLADVRKHANGRPQNDDITIMTFGRNPA